MNVVRRFWFAYQRRRALRQIRAAMAFYGEVLKLTNAEIEDGCLRVAASMRDCGVSAAEATKALIALNRAQERYERGDMRLK